MYFEIVSIVDCSWISIVEVEPSKRCRCIGIHLGHCTWNIKMYGEKFYNFNMALVVGKIQKSRKINRGEAKKKKTRCCSSAMPHARASAWYRIGHRNAGTQQSSSPSPPSASLSLLFQLLLLFYFISIYYYYDFSDVV